jgi:hypothetical protein
MAPPCPKQDGDRISVSRRPRREQHQSGMPTPRIGGHKRGPNLARLPRSGLRGRLASLEPIGRFAAWASRRVTGPKPTSVPIRSVPISNRCRLSTAQEWMRVPAGSSVPAPVIARRVFANGDSPAILLSGVEAAGRFRRATSSACNQSQVRRFAGRLRLIRRKVGDSEEQATLVSRMWKDVSQVDTYAIQAQTRPTNR